MKAASSSCLPNCTMSNTLILTIFFLQLNFFRYDVAMSPPVISLGGYATVNRNLLLSVSDIYIYIYIYICARLREDVPYVKVYRYNPKHLCPKLNGYGDNGQRRVWSSCGSTHCTCQLTILFISVLECGVILLQVSSLYPLNCTCTSFRVNAVQVTAAL